MTTSAKFIDSKARLHQVLARAIAQPLLDETDVVTVARVLPETARNYGGNLGTFQPLVLTWKVPSHV